MILKSGFSTYCVEAVVYLTTLKCVRLPSTKNQLPKLSDLPNKFYFSLIQGLLL